MSERQRSLQEIVDLARTMPPDRQTEFVREACASDEAKYIHALEQLRSQAAWLSDADEGHPDQDFEPRDATGEHIGPYQITRSLGAGGMGEVFLAERVDDQFRQQVAIKLVRRGLLTRHIQGRLRLERQILATLNHPNIARLYDGGAMEDGTPYIVMEYVDGEPIDTYCDKRKLTVENRLLLFKTVCAAVHRAHQNLIVHRDLKPSNILVTADGTPKLLDFGIAKVLDSRQMMHTIAVTQADVRVMTPDHASPEQIRGEPITTASDIYVLGVLLYELLCGFKPFSFTNNRLSELERAICEDTPLSPSTAVTIARRSHRGDLDTIAAERSVAGAKLRRQLRGDLDNIVLMAMRKEPERRYSSVEQFAADIDRYLQGLPVLARADAWAYRTGKFIRRHGVVVSASVAFIGLLVSFSITTYLQSEQIRRERDLATSERSRAQSEQERAEAVASFLIDSFRLADPAQARGNSITAREILDSGATRISTELKNQPRLQASLLDTIGRVYLSLGQAADAEPLMLQGLSIRRRELGPNSLDVAKSLYSLSQVSAERSDLAAAEKLIKESLAVNLQLTGEDSLETAQGLCQLGVIEQRQGQLDRAKKSLQSCLDIRTARLGENHELVTAPLDNLAELAQHRHDFATVEQLYQRILGIDRKTYGPDHPQSIRHLHNLALALETKGDLSRAETLYREAIAAYSRVLGPTHPETIDANANMGSLLLEKGELNEAERLFESTLALNRKVRGERHPYVGYDMVNLGRLSMKKGDVASAQRWFRQALEIYEEKLPPGHVYAASAWTALGLAYIEDNHAEEADKALTNAMNSWAQALGEQGVDYAMAAAARGKARAMQGRSKDAEQALTKNYPVVVQSRGADDEHAKLIHGWIEDFYASQHRPEAADEFFAQLANERSQRP